MKKEEKTRLTRERILAAGILEFGSKSYDAASINSICEAGQISKGLLYHNFKSKDDLYLHCVKHCYDQLIAAFKAQPFTITSAEEGLQKVLLIRQSFFSENPLYANIFFNAVLQPPRHLIPELDRLHKDLDDYFSQCYLEVLDHLTLRDTVTKTVAMEYFTAVCEMFNGYFQNKARQDGDYRTLIQAHEGTLSTIFDVMLYGIAKKPPETRS